MHASFLSNSHPVQLKMALDGSRYIFTLDSGLLALSLTQVALLGELRKEIEAEPREVRQMLY